jgi:hypothetical protein
MRYVSGLVGYRAILDMVELMPVLMTGANYYFLGQNQHLAASGSILFQNYIVELDVNYYM